ncbi:MAG: helix-turn-helix domain-containing protein [Chthoniobacteraceae bacterium]
MVKKQSVHRKNASSAALAKLRDVCGVYRPKGVRQALSWKGENQALEGLRKRQAPGALNSRCRAMLWGAGFLRRDAVCGNQKGITIKKPQECGIQNQKKSHSSKVPVPNQFGRNISRLRLERSLTQNRLCELAEIDRSYLQRIEKGQFQPTLPVILRLKRALDCSWDMLMKGVEAPPFRSRPEES